MQWENVTDEQLINEVRKRGYIIKDAAVTMTRDDILRMAQEASDGVLSYDAEGRWILSEQEVIQLAASVAAAEREACAKICDETRYTGYVPAEDGGARQYYDAAAEDCAEQIRARGEQEQPR